MKSDRGGVLLDLFIILVLAGTGAWVWMRWGARPGPQAAPAVSTAGAAEDLAERGARLQGRVRALLTKHGVSEPDVLKNFTRERSDGRARWLEDTLVIDPPRGFDRPLFLRDLARVLEDAGLFLMENRSGRDGWTVALGDNRRVFERIVFEGQLPVS